MIICICESRYKTENPFVSRSSNTKWRYLSSMVKQEGLVLNSTCMDKVQKDCVDSVWFPRNFIKGSTTYLLQNLICFGWSMIGKSHISWRDCRFWQKISLWMSAGKKTSPKPLTFPLCHTHPMWIYTSCLAFWWSSDITALGSLCCKIIKIKSAETKKQK